MKKFALLLLLPILVGCGDNPTPSSNGYFKQYKDQVTDLEKEYSFITLYDGVENQSRFSLEFLYEPHFHFGLKITEYAVQPVIHYPNEGIFSNDYESVTFTLVNSTSALFPKGKYVLSHYLDNEIDQFRLTCGNTVYPLTSEKKKSPYKLNPGLYGKFEYQVNEEALFEIKVEESNDTEVIVSLKENEKEFTASEYSMLGDELDFKIIGNSDGTYLKNNTLAKFIYNDEGTEEEMWTLYLGSVSYHLTYIHIDPVDPTEGYFRNNKVILSNNSFSCELVNVMGGLGWQVKLTVGEKSIYTFFTISDDGESLSSSGINLTPVFEASNTYRFTHYLEGTTDKVDLFKNDVIYYQDLTIQTVR